MSYLGIKQTPQTLSSAEFYLNLLSVLYSLTSQTPTYLLLFPIQPILLS